MKHFHNRVSTTKRNPPNTDERWVLLRCTHLVLLPHGYCIFTYASPYVGNHFFKLKSNFALSV